jgi:polygalacturonase
MKRLKLLVAARVAAALALAALGTAAYASSLQVYPYPPQLQYTHHNDDFTVQARLPGGKWQDLYEWNVKVDHDKPQDASMVYFDFTGTVELRIQKNNGDFSKVSIGPRTGAPQTRRIGDKIYLTLTHPQNFAIFFDDDRLHNLHVFAGAPIAAPTGPNVIRFGPGLHKPANDGEFFTVASGQTVYLDGGAVLQGAFKVDGARDVTILGHGLILPPSGKDGNQFEIARSQNVRLEGPIVVQADAGIGRVGQSKDVRIADVKGITAGKWTDGINVYSSERVALDHLFMRTSDDCVTVYAHRWDYYGDVRDVRVTNSTLWADIAHAMFVGIHGDSVHPDVIERLTFDNIDVVNVDEDDPEYEGVMAITAGDSNIIRDVTFSNVRVDRIEEAKLFNLHVGYNPKWNTSPGGGIERVTFRNISYTGDGMPSPSVIFGYDSKRGVRNILIDNLTIAGRKATSPATADLEIGKFVEDVRFK